MKIGLYFGSFNPVHIGHLIIANHVLNSTDIKRIWFIVSPQNPLKKSNTLLNEHNRLHLVRLAIEDNTSMSASDVEFKLPRPSYTIDTLAHLKEKYPDNEFSLIMGSDSFHNINKWKNSNQIIANHRIIIYLRSSFIIQATNPNIVILKETPMIDISATCIRNLIRQRKSIRYLVPEKAVEEIEACGYYKK